MMDSDAHYIGQRLSLNSHTCTVRYTGQVEGKAGEWLGVEWDDRHKGKHDGSYEGKTYFTCRSSSYVPSSPASFIRPSQAWDKPRTFLEALSDRYFQVDDSRSDEIIYVSRSKQIEEVGFEKFALRQAELRGIHVLVLSQMQVRHSNDPVQNKEISSICENITELDIGGNLFETFDEVLDLCQHFPKLKRLILDGNRFKSTSNEHNRFLDGVRMVSLSATLLNSSELAECLSAFPQVEEVQIADNVLSSCDPQLWPQGIRVLDLSRNHFDKIRGMQPIFQLPRLGSLNLQHNRIAECSLDSDPPATTTMSSTLQSLDLRFNEIGTWRILGNIDGQFPSLRHLCVSGNPLYSHMVSAEGRPLAKSDGYMLTIARLPRLESLNYSTITDQMRLNSERYYQDQIVAELLRNPESMEDSILSRHPRWQALCEEYGKPVIDRAQLHMSVNPNSLAARLVEIEFHLALDVLPYIQQRSFTQEVPKAFDIYALYGIVGRQLDQIPLRLRLILETGELDPVGDTISGKRSQEWYSSDEEGDIEWISREIELKPGTRPVGSYVEKNAATIRIELQSE